MRMLLSILFLLSASLFRGTGQVREITGTVKCATGSLPGALVTVTTEADDHVLAYAVADAEGHFALKVAEAAQGSRFIHARMMGYTAQKVLLTPDRSEYAFVLAEASVMLKEVKVRATPISGAGDTTRYLASSFARENDITLADVIKRMPGFHISADGRIKYAGREISNFYIDGSDMMTGNYTTAIRSIKHGDVGRVEVIEHHQPIKLFEDLLFSDQTAVNVTLKETAKNRWVGVVEAGGGVPRLWQVDASAMRFAQKVKTMNTYKGNNTGRDVVGGGTSGGGSAREVIALPSADNPYLERSRTLFNRSHRLSLNNQWDMGRSFTLTPCMELFGAETESDAAETRRYYLDDGQTRELTTRQSGRRRLHGASPSVRLEANTRRMYLSNVLTSDIRRSSGHTDAVGTYSNVADGQVDGAYLRNDLYALFRRGRRVVGIKSAIEWSRLPQRLDIRRAEAEMGERIGASAFRVQTSTSQMIGFGRATLSLEEGFSYDQSAFQSDLRGVIPADSARNDFCYRTALTPHHPFAQHRPHGLEIRALHPGRLPPQRLHRPPCRPLLHRPSAASFAHGIRRPHLRSPRHDLAQQLMAKPARGSLCVFLRAPRRVVSLPADWHDGLQPCGDDDRERHDPLQKHPSRPFWQPHLHPHVATQPTDAHAGLWRDLHHVRLRTSPPPQPLGLRGRQPQLYDPRHSRWRDPERQHLVQPVATHAERSLATAHKLHASAGPARLRLAPFLARSGLHRRPLRLYLPPGSRRSADHPHPAPATFGHPHAALRGELHRLREL